jgi:DNA-directed RNA polymerase subunit RPC12/RpoP
MSTDPQTEVQCAGCGRRAFDWVPVPRGGRTVHWTPDLREVREGVYKCWPCRRELHPGMPSDYLEFNDE